jgi:hypothetical protein
MPSGVVHRIRFFHWLSNQAFVGDGRVSGRIEIELIPGAPRRGLRYAIRSDMIAGLPRR